MSDIENQENIESSVPAGVPADVPAGGKPPRMDGVPPEKQAPVVPEADKRISKEEPAIESGNPVLDTAIHAVMATSGATADDLERIAGAAIAAGDISKLDYQYLYENFKDHAQAIIQLAGAVLEAKSQTDAQLTNAVYALAGGEANWNAAVGMFNQVAPDYMKTVVKTMIDSGKVQEGAKVLMEFVSSAGVVPHGTEPNVTTVARGMGNTGLSAAEFKAEMQKLKQEAGNRSLESGQFAGRYNDLLTRRAQGRQLGM